MAGPDGELADAIERDIVDLGNAVEWDSVAGNDEVKELLEEALVLPMIMPDFFKGKSFSLRANSSLLVLSSSLSLSLSLCLPQI